MIDDKRTFPLPIPSRYTEHQEGIRANLQNVDAQIASVITHFCRKGTFFERVERKSGVEHLMKKHAERAVKIKFQSDGL